MKTQDSNQASNDLELFELNKNRQLFAANILMGVTKAGVIPNTYWEQLMGVGYNPDFKRLEAVVNINQTSGYNGGLCGTGSCEYIRFFVDFKDGFGFINMGYASFKAADISNAPMGPHHPLSYMVYLFINDANHKKFLDCNTAVIPVVRAVLSWNTVPSLNPNVSPHHGNILNAHIQLSRKNLIIWKDFVELTKMTALVQYPIAPNFEVQLKVPEVAEAANIYKINADAGISDHRTFYASVGSVVKTTLDFSKATSILALKSFSDYNIDISQFYDFFNGAGKNADVSFEELTTVGLNSDTDTFGAVIHVKKQNGFSGNMCTKGSMEHVSFWADWNNDGIFDTYLGTASANVHDITNIPAGGLYYNVALPVNLTKHLTACSVPNVVRIRAVLSWESLPSTSDPNKLNHWGNFKDVLVQLRPSGKGSGIHSAIEYVGNVDRNMIHPTEFLYNYQLVAPSINNNRPWGGSILFNGIIHRNGFAGVVKYKILYKKHGASVLTYQPVSTSEVFRLDDLSTIAPAYDDPQTDPNGLFIYESNVSAGGSIYNVDNKLATWETGALTDGTYDIRFVHTDEFANEIIADEFSMIICNKPITVSPTANTSVDFSFDLDLVIDGGDCHSYTKESPLISGHLRATHPYFAEWTLEIQPTAHTHNSAPVPTSRIYGSLGDVGDANSSWNLNVSALDPCGYTVALVGYTRVIFNSSTNFPNSAPKAVGFAKLS